MCAFVLDGYISVLLDRSVTRPPAISAIIIVLNGEGFLEQAIESIRNQSESDWELIIVDDGSIDSTPAIVAKAMALDARISTVNHPDRANKGMSASRNLGVAVACGRYIAFLDADDIWLPDKLSMQRKLLDEDPSLGMVYGRVKIWRSWASSLALDDFFYDLGVDPDRSYEPPSLLTLLMQNRYQSPTTCGSLIRRAAILNSGGFDPAFRGMFEDQVFYARLLAQYRVHVSDQCVALYRSHDDGYTARMGDNLAVAHAHWRYLSATERYLEHRRLESTVLKRAICLARRDLIIGTAKHYVRGLLDRKGDD